jgi:hypothetical protein
LRCPWLFRGFCQHYDSLASDISFGSEDGDFNDDDGNITQLIHNVTVKWPTLNAYGSDEVWLEPPPKLFASKKKRGLSQQEATTSSRQTGADTVTRYIEAKALIDEMAHTDFWEDEKTNKAGLERSRW